MRDLQRWLAEAKKKKAKYIISVCDTFDYDDYPVYCKDKKEMEKALKHYNGKNMQSINEVIKVK